MTQVTAEKLRDPTVGMIVTMPHHAIDGLTMVFKVVAVGHTRDFGTYRTSKIQPAVDVIAVKGLIHGGNPRWVEDDIIPWPLALWRRRTPKMTRLPDDWQLPEPKCRKANIAVLESDAMDLAERIQALAGRIPDEEHAALCAASQFALAWLNTKMHDTF